MGSTTPLISPSTIAERPPDLSGNGRVKAPDPSEQFSSPGFGFVRYFLLFILLIVGLTGAIVGILSWHLGMDVTVEGQGSIEPKIRRQVKTAISGLIAQIHVKQGQHVSEGDRIVTLDDTELRTELKKVNRELAVNASRRAEIEAQIRQERGVLKAEVFRARMERETVTLQLEQVRKEYALYYRMYRPLNGSPRKPLDDLLPIRLRRSVLYRAEADLERAQRRLDAVAGREQEIQTLDRIREKLEQDRTLLEYRLSQTVIHAPVSGTVLTGDLHRRVGDRLQLGEAVLELAELDAWRAKVLVQEVDIPKVKPGQAVRLYVNAFPHMEYRIFEGAVEEVPSEPVVPSPPGNGSVSPGVAYPVKVSIRDPRVSDGERIYTLAYGMGVEAKIVVERGRVVDLLWRKLLKTAGKLDRHDFHILEHETKESNPAKTGATIRMAE